MQRDARYFAWAAALSRGVELALLDDEECYRLMQDFIRANPALWYEDIGL